MNRFSLHHVNQLLRLWRFDINRSRTVIAFIVMFICLVVLDGFPDDARSFFVNLTEHVTFCTGMVIIFQATDRLQQLLQRRHAFVQCLLPARPAEKLTAIYCEAFLVGLIIGVLAMAILLAGFGSAIGLRFCSWPEGLGSDLVKVLLISTTMMLVFILPMISGIVAERGAFNFDTFHSFSLWGFASLTANLILINFLFEGSLLVVGYVVQGLLSLGYIVLTARKGHRWMAELEATSFTDPTNQSERP
jgi:hypothetical protein